MLGHMLASTLSGVYTAHTPDMTAARVWVSAGPRASYPAAMAHDWLPTALLGVMRRSVQMHDDVRGSFGEIWRASSTATLTAESFVQANLSRSEEGVLRGVHFHLRQKDMWVVLEGRAHVCLVDLRDRLAGGSTPPLAVAEVYEPGDAVLIPEGVAHGFWALDPVSLLYLVTNEYDGTDEHGFAWNDPDAAAEWPAGVPTLSERDAAAPSLAEAIEAAQRLAQISSR